MTHAKFKAESKKSFHAKIKKHGGTSRAYGGKAHSDEPQDRQLIKSMVKPGALKRANGGRAHKRGAHTHVNIMVAPGQQGAVPPGVAGAGGAGPMLGAASRPPVPPVAPPPGGMPPGGLSAMGARPPGFAKGGRTYDAGAGSGEGRLEKCAVYEKRARRK